jgi:hypothetical protein
MHKMITFLPRHILMLLIAFIFLGTAKAEKVAAVFIQQKGTGDDYARKAMCFSSRP